MTMQSLGVFPVRYRPHSAEDGKLNDYQVANVEVFVDSIRLSQMLGPRALLSKTSRSVEAGGRVEVRVV